MSLKGVKFANENNFATHTLQLKMVQFSCYEHTEMEYVEYFMP